VYDTRCDLYALYALRPADFEAVDTSSLMIRRDSMQARITGDLPLAGDWNGDGVTEIGLYRPSTSTWYPDRTSDGMWGTGDVSFRSGADGDTPVTADWNGDGITDIGTFRPSTGYWYFDYHLDGSVDKTFRYGGKTDLIMSGDWDGDGRDGIAIFRPATGYWYFDYNLDGKLSDRSGMVAKLTRS